MAITSRRRRTTMQEMCWLQGLRPPTELSVTKRQYGRMLGNAMSGNVVERLLRRVLIALGRAQA